MRPAKLMVFERHNRRALVIATVYASLAGAWIYSSDALLRLLTSDPSLFATMSTWKGWVFVAVTSILLFKLLQGVPQPAGEAGTKPESAEPIPFKIWPPLVIFFLFVSAVGATGYLVYRGIARAAREKAEETLAAVADLKRQQVGDWLGERRGNAERASRSPFMAPETEAWLERGAPDDETAARLLRRLQGLRATHRWSSVYLTDRQGTVKIDLEQRQHHSEASRRLAVAAMESKQVLFWDIHADPEAGPGRMEFGFFAPLIVKDAAGERAIAAIVMEMDPSSHLFPIVASWPLPSRSGESLLVRREGDSVLYLSDLRHRRDAALAFGVPMSSRNFVGARALTGERGPMEGLDYRQTAVLACARRIPATAWVLIAKVDMQEVNGPVVDSARLVALFGMVLVFAAGLATGFWLRQQRASALVRYYRDERERASLTRQLDNLTRYANDIILLMDESGRVIDANDRALAAYGHRRDELIGTDVRSLRAPAGRDSFAQEWARSEQEDGIIFETMHQRKDGTIFPVEVSARAIPVEGSVLRQSIIRDISERKEAEERALLWANVLENSAEGIIITDAEARILQVNKAFTAVTGYPPEEAIGANPKILSSGHHEPAFYHVMWRTLRETGRWQGEIWNRRRNGETYPGWLSITAVRGSSGELTHYVGVFSDISERKESADRIHFLANHDSLTSLPNRAVMNDLIQQALAVARRKGSTIALLFLDLDRFKTINDSLGHPIGDALLQCVAQRLTKAIREEDRVGRLGGDEFLILLPELSKSEDAAVVAEKVLGSLRDPIVVDDHNLGITASIGISIYPDDGADVATLIKNADAAMYHAKERGRNNYQFFTPDMNARAFEALAMEMSLRGALERKEFTLHYQPQVQTGTGHLIAAEALIRWNHPELGSVSPGRFIPVAEEHGLIVPIGEWVLRTACSQVRQWLDEGLDAVPVAVNMSAVQFRQSGLAAKVRAILDEAGIEPRYLELEVTESIIMREAEQAIAVLQELSEMGVSLSIDDFGTGYSSLSYLRRFPIDRLKIDQSFVRDITTNPDAAAIAAAIIGMGRSMKLRVVAEGVETAEQQTFLTAERCDEMQGFHIGRPMEAHRFSALLREGQPLVGFVPG